MRSGLCGISALPIGLSECVWPRGEWPGLEGAKEVHVGAHLTLASLSYFGFTQALIGCQQQRMFKGQQVKGPVLP